MNKKSIFTLVCILVMCIAVTGCQTEPIKVSSISVSPESLSLTEGETGTLVATISPSNADNKKVIWTSSNTSVASVNNGVVNAVNEGSSTIYATSYDGYKTASCTVEVKAKIIPVESIELDRSSLEITEGNKVSLVVSIKPENASDKTLWWKCSDWSIVDVSEEGVVSALKAGKATLTVTTVDQSRTATCEVTVTPYFSTVVDLGLSVKWATCNLGASKPEDYGGYYQWAGLEDLTDIRKDFPCPYHIGEYSSSGWTKYITSIMSSDWSGPGDPDNKTILDPEDDVAHVKLGGKWRMPTMEEFDELRTNCTSEWTTLNGTKGRKFISNKNGNWIFLPAAGDIDKGVHYDANYQGLYWSSSLNETFPHNAYILIFTSDEERRGSHPRGQIYPVRPVSE